jgi:hypothetical protein
MGLAGPIGVEPDDELTKNGLLGSYKNHERVIRIADELDPSLAYLVLYHEFIEAALADSGLQNLIRGKKLKRLKEAFCDAIAVALLAEFKSRNSLS